ncbi:MAG: HlyD family type I secretion periplasmic adaptor subunit [Cloacibacillus sp.]
MAAEHKAKGGSTIRDRQELEFLPAALEIVETPPSPIGRMIVWIVVLFFIIALAWSYLGHVDEVAVASGKVIPSGHTKVVQAEDKGIVRKIHVSDGFKVKAGDVLIELDTVLTAADMDRYRKERDFFKLDLARLYSEKDGTYLSPPTDINLKEEAFLQQELTLSRRREFSARSSALKQQILAAKANLENSTKQYEKYYSMLPIASEQMKRTKELVSDGTITLFEHQKYVQQEIEVRQNMLSQRADVERNRHIVQEAEMELKRVVDEWYTEINSRIVENERQLKAVEEELVKAEEKHRLSRIVSPINGTVQQLSVHTEGAVVQPAQALMLIVPDNAGVEFEVWLENKDIGFVFTGQAAEVKVDTFGFQRYGTLEATVKTVANDAKDDEKRGLIYQVYLISSRDSYLIDGREAPLLPGMSVTGEIKIKQKRIIEYFLDTFRRYTNEGLRER